MSIDGDGISSDCDNGDCARCSYPDCQHRCHTRNKVKARGALKKLEELEAKRAEQRKTERELRRTLEHRAYEPRRRTPNPGSSPSTCAECGRRFIPGREVLEYLDDDGRVVTRYCYPPCAR